MTPIYKKGQKEDPGNCRPVSLTSVPGKIMERIILGELSRQVQGRQGIRAKTRVSEREVLLNQLDLFL